MKGDIYTAQGGLPEEDHFGSGIKWAAEQMPGGFLVYRADETQEVLYVNKAAIHMFGCSTKEEFKELTGCTFRGMVHPEDLAMVQAAIDAQIADTTNGNMDYVEYRIVRRDGSIRWVDDYGHYGEMPGYGKVYYVFLSDTTEKKQIQEENRFAAEVIEGLSVDYACIYLLNLDTGGMRTYHLKNDFFREISRKIGIPDGQKADWREVLKTYAEIYIIPDDRDLFLAEIADDRLHARLAEEASFSVNYRCHAEGGGVAYVSMSVNRAESDAQNHHVIMGFRDVTEETLAFKRELAVKMETELELEREKHANEIKSQFLFNVSHDIRTPMNAVMGYAGLAKRHLANPQLAEEYLERVEESGSQLLSLIEDLLEMSSIGYGQIELKEKPADLYEQMNMVLELFRIQADEKGILFSEEIDLPEKEVLVDAERFRRILSNLVSNAVKFTPKGGRIKISAQQKFASESGYARYEFAVSDTGIGMSQEFMQRLYQAFERESTSTKSKTTGSGLGLSIAKSLVDIMGGTLAVQSEKGKGSTFTLSLPLKLADHAAQNHSEVSDENEHKDGGKHRILLVEDIEINRMLAETILEESGFLVDSVADGCDAVEAVKNHSERYYDLILMDIQMPVMNGYEAARAIRSMHREDVKSLPIIALSANAREEDKRMSIESGMNSHVPKPFDAVKLISVIDEHISINYPSDNLV